MNVTKSGRRSRAARTPAPDRRQRLAGVVRRLSGAITVARAGITTLVVRVPGTVHATRVGAHGATSALQALPDSTLRWLAASSVGLGAGFSLAGAPRLVVAASVTPALILGAAMVARPIEHPFNPRLNHLRTIDMTDEHVKGAISKAEGRVEEAFGTLTGDKHRQARGKVRQIQGDAQKGLGDIQDAVREPRKTA